MKLRKWKKNSFSTLKRRDKFLYHSLTLSLALYIWWYRCLWVNKFRKTLSIIPNSINESFIHIIIYLFIYLNKNNSMNNIYAYVLFHASWTQSSIKLLGPVIGHVLKGRKWYTCIYIHLCFYNLVFSFIKIVFFQLFWCFIHWWITFTRLVYAFIHMIFLSECWSYFNFD